MEEKFNYAKKGYDTAEVNNYIAQLEAVVNSYREKDTAIKNALISAQMAADNIIKNAELEADKIKGKAVSLLDGIINSIGDQKQFVKEFQEEYNVIINKYVRQYNDAEILKLYSKISELEDYVASLQNNASTTQTTENLSKLSI